ncbi:restriction endonuclease [Dubosiella newyorkensis]|uniref:restriction endonuclease n=1 Tax=Dubosiella newyorkensis TaxID=1862672 RepID=UPI0023F0E5AE|nr:restriction endonuclease [Dubosiella newyorkensis]
MQKEFDFDELKNAPLVIDAIYKGGPQKNKGGEPISKLMNVGNSSGFRPRLRKRATTKTTFKDKYAYIVLYTTMEELEWPDFLDLETGVFRYYGDNRKGGNNVFETRQKGNLILKDTFDLLHSGKTIRDIPPFFIFKKSGNGKDVKFLGLAAPGNPNISQDKDLVMFWRTMHDDRFQNLEAYFTVLDIKDEEIDRQWLDALINDHENNLEYAPKAWKSFIEKGREGIVPLKAKKIQEVPTRYWQLQSDNEGKQCLEIIHDYYSENPYGFEKCAVDLVQKMDNHFSAFELTRPWRDGGFDAKGTYLLEGPSKRNIPLHIECALEAKCYDKTTGVGVKQMSRLISRIRYREFGIMVTTSYVDTQAYKEVIEDGHPILIITAADIAQILRNNSINVQNIKDWLHRLDQSDLRF